MLYIIPRYLFFKDVFNFLNIQNSLIIYIRNNENKIIQTLYILLNIVISTNTITNSIYIIH